MEIFHFRKMEAPGPHDAVVTIGNFDGVHLGHQALIAQVVREAAELEVKSALLTFHPHPQSVVRGTAPPVITTPAQRMRLFRQLGLDSSYFIPFTAEFAAKTPETFVQEYLLSYFQVRKLLIGHDFHFGKDRSGSAEVLERLSIEHGFAFEIFPDFSLGSEKVSSSKIRAVLAEPDFRAAERLLGRPFSILEKVTPGEQRGRALGFPTLNQVVEDQLPIPFGVYASRVGIDERSRLGVSNYGIRPTVGGETPVLETHLFDFDEDLYGELVEVYPLHLMRGERRFPSLEALKAQIAKDVEQAQAFHRAPR